MELIKRISTYAYNIFNDIGASSKLHWLIPDKLYLSVKFHHLHGWWMSWKNPKTFNEKMQWLKINYRENYQTQLVDKYEVKAYINKVLGEEYIIPTLGVYESFEEIDFDLLPEQFVLKCTHDSGGVVIVPDKQKLDIAAAKTKLERSLQRNYFWGSREWPYKNIKPRIIAEKYMIDARVDDLRDFKFFCFDGKVQFFKVDFDRQIEHHANYYDPEGNILPFGESLYPPVFERKIEIPDNLSEMIALAEKLSEGTPFMRVDFYDIDGAIYFGEITFFPMSGMDRFTVDSWEHKVGNMIKLPLEVEN